MSTSTASNRRAGAAGSKPVSEAARAKKSPRMKRQRGSPVSSWPSGTSPSLCQSITASSDEFLMSSLFTASEIALARLGLAELSGADLDVVVGGLGLGYTARAVLEHEAVKSLVIVEALDAVIDW